MSKNQKVQELVSEFKKLNPLTPSEIRSAVFQDNSNLSYFDLLNKSKEEKTLINKYHLGLLKLKSDITKVSEL